MKKREKRSEEKWKREKKNKEEIQMNLMRKIEKKRKSKLAHIKSNHCEQAHI